VGEFSAGSVIGRSFSIWLRNFIPFTILSLVVFSPMIFWSISLTSGTPTLDSVRKFALYSTPLTMVFGLISTGAMTYGVFQQLRGTPASIGKCLGVGIGRLFPVLGVGIMAGLAMLVGFVALIIPGFIVMCMLWVAVPVAVVERPGVFGSLSRSSDLTKGHRGSVFGVIFLLGVINWIVSFVTQKAIVPDPQTVKDLDAFMHALRVYLVVSMLESAVLAALSAVAAAVGYHDLRVSKEGVDTNQLATVFD
jgi:hypothetical protein